MAPPKKPNAKTNAQRQREYMARKRERAKNLASNVQEPPKTKNNSDNLEIILSVNKRTADGKPFRQYRGRKSVAFSGAMGDDLATYVSDVNLDHSTNVHTNSHGTPSNIDQNDLTALNQIAVDENKKIKKTNAQICREYRIRKKMRQNNGKSRLQEQNEQTHGKIAEECKMYSNMIIKKESADINTETQQNAGIESATGLHTTLVSHELFLQQQALQSNMQKTVTEAIKQVRAFRVKQRWQPSELNLEKRVKQTSTKRVRAFRARQRAMAAGVANPSTTSIHQRPEQQQQPFLNSDVRVRSDTTQPFFSFFLQPSEMKSKKKVAQTGSKRVQSSRARQRHSSELNVKKRVKQTSTKRVRAFRARQRAMAVSTADPSTTLIPQPRLTSNVRQDASVIKERTTINDSNYEASLRHGMKQEMVEIELTALDGQMHAQNTTPLVGVYGVDTEQRSCIKVEAEEIDLDIGPTLVQPMDSCYKVNQLKTCVDKLGNAIVDEGSNSTCSKTVKKERVEDNLKDPLSADDDQIEHIITIKVEPEDTDLDTEPTVLESCCRNNEQMKENMINDASNNTTLCEAVKEERNEDEQSDNDQQSRTSNSRMKNTTILHSTVGKPDTKADTSTQQHDVVRIKKEIVDVELETSSNTVEHVDCKHSAHKPKLLIY